MNETSSNCNNKNARFQYCSSKHREIKNELRSKIKKYESSETKTKQLNIELRKIKEQYIRTKERYQQEQQEYDLKYSRLQRELRIEQRRVEELEKKLIDLKKSSKEIIPRKEENDPCNVVEQMWNLMQKYRDTIHNDK